MHNKIAKHTRHSQSSTEHGHAGHHQAAVKQHHHHVAVLQGCPLTIDDADDAALQSEIEAHRTATRNQHRGSHGAQLGMLTARQLKQNWINNPHHQRTYNQTSTEHEKQEAQ
jgi:hypothetical protein